MREKQALEACASGVLKHVAVATKQTHSETERDSYHTVINGITHKNKQLKQEGGTYDPPPTSGPRKANSQLEINLFD